MRLLLRLVAMFVMVFLGGCSDDDAGGQRRDEPPETGTTGTRTDEADASSVVLRLTDFPQGWRTADEHPDTAKIADCSSVSAALDRRGPEATASFAEVDGQAAVTNTITVWPSVEAADMYLDAWADPAIADCAAAAGRQHVLATLGREPALQPFEVLDVAFEQLPPSEIGERSTGQRVTTRVQAADTQAELIGDYLLIRLGRVTAGLELGNVDTPIGGDLRARLISGLLKRPEDLDQP